MTTTGSTMLHLLVEWRYWLSCSCRQCGCGIDSRGLRRRDLSTSSRVLSALFLSTADGSHRIESARTDTVVRSGSWQCGDRLFELCNGVSCSIKVEAGLPRGVGLSYPAHLVTTFCDRVC